MKKTLVVLAALTATGAFAQSNYTLFGVVDLGIGNYSGASGPSVTKIVSNGLGFSHLGFKGSEALAGGLGGHFWIEAGFLPQNGSFQTTNTNNISTGGTGGGGLTFNRRSTLSLSGAFGELRLGRDITPGFWSKTIFEPFGTNGVGSAFSLSTKLLAENTVRASNSLSWLYNIAPNGASHGLGSKGMYAQAMYAWGGNVADSVAGVKSTDGNLAGLRIGYADNGMNVAFASERTQNSAAAHGGSNLTSGSYSTSNIAASYSASNSATVIVNFNTNKNGKGDQADTWLLGAVLKVSDSSSIPVSYTKYSGQSGTVKGQSATQFALGFTNSMSARTTVYGTFATVSNSGGSNISVSNAPGAGTAVDFSSNGFEVGIKHSF